MKAFRGISLTMLAIALATPAFTRANAAEVDMANHMRFDIGASDLRSAISRFSVATGVQILVAPDVVSGRRTAGVHGNYTIRKALDQLLAGTSILASPRGGVIILKRASEGTHHPQTVQSVQMSAAAAEAPAGGEADTPPPADIIVSGYRNSLAAAQNLKRRAVGAEDDILATDIAAFPVSTWRNRSSGFPALRSRATAAKAARSRCAGLARISHARS